MKFDINAVLNNFKKQIRDVRPFLKTKTGSRFGLIFVLLFILLFFAPLFHEFVGAAIVGCVGTVFFILMWRKNDKEHVIVPAVFFCIPMLLDMAIYHTLPIVSCFIVAIAALFICAKAKLTFFDKITDSLYTYLAAGAVCAVTVVLAVIFMVIVSVSWWILCIVAFILLIALFFAVVFSTAAYTASDGRRQARKKFESDRERRDERTSQRERSSDRDAARRNYRPPKRDNKIYNLDDDDFIDMK